MREFTIPLAMDAAMESAANTPLQQLKRQVIRNRGKWAIPGVAYPKGFRPRKHKIKVNPNY